MEAYMNKRPSDRPPRVPDAPDPLSASARDCTESGRALARRYLVNVVRLNAGIAFAPESEAPLHTKYLAAKEIVTIAGVIPQAVPAPLRPHDEDGDSDGDGGEPS
jgi:hypothetical protein